jgi:4-aminobutyrate aminotransferase
MVASMATHASPAQHVSDLRQRYVSGAVATPPIVAARASGARIEDADGTSFIDFAGGLGCLNMGHTAPEVVAAIHAQADLYLHQCFMVAMYEPYVETCRRLADLSPCRGDGDHKSLLVNSGAEANENAVKVARAFTGRPGVVVFDRGFHGRTNLTMAMTTKVHPYKHGFGPLAGAVYRTPAPYPYRGVTTDDAIDGLHQLFKEDVDAGDVACVVLEPVQGEGGFIPMPDDFPRRLLEVCDEHGILYVDDEVQSGMGRTGPIWAIEHFGIEPDILVSGKSLGGGLPLAAITARAEIMDAPEKGGLGGTFGGNPLSCVAANAALDIVATPEYPRAHRPSSPVALRTPLEEDGAATGFLQGVRASARCSRWSSTPASAPSTQHRARASAGLVLLSLRLRRQVIRILVRPRHRRRPTSTRACGSSTRRSARRSGSGVVRDPTPHAELLGPDASSAASRDRAAQPAQPLVRVVVGEDRRRPRPPRAADLDPDARVSLDVLDVVRRVAVLGDDPELVAAQARCPPASAAAGRSCGPWSRAAPRPGRGPRARSRGGRSG